MNYAHPIDCLRATVKEWQWEAEKLRREAKQLEDRAATIYDRSISLDLLADKLEKVALPVPHPDPAQEEGSKP